MAQLVLGAAGAAAGFMIGGPTGAQIGWTAGVMLGGALDPQNTQTSGPRLADLKVQSSAYGAMKSVIYGAMRTNGNVIFCTNKREVATSATTSGKGGPTVTNTTYSYNVDIAIALCANPIAAIRKIWNNGLLIYDQSAGADIATSVASTTTAKSFKVYLGSETQLPDPTLEATLGVGNVPGYRGMAYVVFAGLDCPNGQIPQLSFEVLASGGGTPVVPVVYCDFQAPVVTMGTSATTPAPLPAPGIDRMGNPWTIYGYNTFQQLASAGGGQARVSGFIYSSYVYGCARLGTPANPAFGIAGDFALSISLNDGAQAFTSDNRGALASCMQAIGTAANGEWTLGLDQDFTIGGVPSRQVRFTITGDQSFVNSVVVPITTSDYTIDIRRTAGVLQMFLNGALVGSVGGSTMALSGTSPLQLGQFGTDTNGYNTFRSPNCTFKRFALCAGAGMAGADVPLAGVISDVCSRAGLASAQLDVGALTDTLTGYALTQVSPARANLQPVQQYGFIDGIESDGVLKWAPRSSLVSVASISYDELAAEQDGTAPGDPMALQRTQEADLPRSVAINYLNTAADYQSGTETSRRITTASANDVVTQLPVATTAARAAEAADVQLYDAWNERNQYTPKVSRKYAFLDAGDMITVEYPQGTFTAKRITSANDTGLLIELTLVDSDAAIYTPTAQGASPAQAQIGVALTPGTNLQLLDIPILRDADNTPGLYAALAGYAPGWPGAVLYLGADDASLAPRGGVTQGAVIGAADSLLGNWTSLMMDQSNSVLVTVVNGGLASAARDAVLDTGANLAALGAPGRWEIIAFTTATLTSGTQYQLSGLLRGLYGTEAQAGLHAVGDVFVLLQLGGLLRPNFDLSELNQPRQFRAITTGQSINTAGSITAADTGVGLKPYNPVNLRRSTDASNNITLTWDRRTRSSVDFPANGVDVPLFETVESYSIDVYSSNTFATLVRTIAANSATAAYTAAQQTADGLTPGATLNVRVYQIGVAGRGYPFQGTL